MTLDTTALVALCQFCGEETTAKDPTALLCDRCNLAQVAVERAHLDHVSGHVWTGGPL